jgi:hypothetical protein
MRNGRAGEEGSNSRPLESPTLQRRRAYEIGYRGSGGKQRWERVPGEDNLPAALARRDEILGRKRQGERIEPTRMTLDQVVEVWRQDRAYVKLRPRPRVMYDSSLRLHVLPRLGRRAVAKITDGDIAALIAAMEAVVTEGRRAGRRAGPRSW